jgi:thermitase
VLDTGVISTTEDLAGRILPALSAVPNQQPLSDSFLSASNWVNGFDQYENRRHGTWVASVVAMGINNGQGGAGIGNFSILPIGIIDSSSNTSESWIANGIRMAADNGAKVINISYPINDYEPLDAAAAYARSKGALTFMSAGNTNAYRDIPDFSNLIFVGGTGPNDERWSQWIINSDGIEQLVGSSYGSFVGISAPAQSILLADPTLIHGYGLNNGTSFAAPMVAGAAALAWSINPNLTPDQVEQMLYSTADDLGDPGRDQIYGWGRLNVGKLANAAYQSTVPEPATWVMLISMGMAAFLWHRRSKPRITA